MIMDLDYDLYWRYMNKLWLVILACLINGTLVMRAHGQSGAPVRVGVYENKPKLFIDEDGEPKGFFIDLLNHIAADQGFDIEYKQVSFAEGMQLVETGQLDIMPDVVINSDRRKRYYMSRVTILENWASLYIHEEKEPDYFTLQDLLGHSIGVMENDDNYISLKQELGADSLGVSFRVYRSYPEVFQGVESGEVEMGLVNFFFGINQQRQFKVQKLELVVNPSSIHIAGNQQSRYIINRIDRSLINLKHDSDSQYYQLIDEWLDPNPPFKFPQWLTILLLILAIVLFIGLVFTLYLQTQLRASRIKLNFSNKLLKQQVQEKNVIENSLRIRNEELISTNDALDHFIYQLSHNLRAPIASVSGLINLARIEPESGAEHLNKMDDSIRLLDRTIADIMTYYRNKRIDVAMEEIDLETLLDEVLASVSVQVSEARIKVSRHTRIDAKCVGDKYRIRSILHNLISNAVKYHNPRQEICIIDISLHVGAKTMEMVVRDNGIGISADQLNNIFSMFYRATDRGQGAGLGLYIVKESVDKLDGKVTVNSGDGFTEFKVVVPNKTQSAVSSPA